MIEVTEEMMAAFLAAWDHENRVIADCAGEYVEAGARDRAGLAAVLAIVERDWNMQPNPNARPLSLAVGRIAAYCGRVERPHGGHVWNTSVDRWCPGDEVPGRPEPRLTDSGSYASGAES